MNRLRSAPLLALALSGVAAAATPTWSDMVSTSGWQEYTTREHADAGVVTVHQKDIAGLPCFQGVATTKLSMDTLLSVVMDVEGAKKWSSAGVTEAKLLARDGNTMEYYQYLDVPGWTMASDRFWFVRSTLEKGADRTVFRWERLAEGGSHTDAYAKVKAEHPSAVEPPVNVGGWVFTPKGDAIEIRYVICTDTGGSIPTAVESMATSRTLPDTVGDVVREGKRRAAP